jgi:CheY-like chemotaxis protein
VSVKDTGAGLPPEKLAQLFQSFNRLGQEGSAEEGTGIGLVVTKRLVELMGGSIGVESTVGLGSTFWFELAAEAAPHPPVDGVLDQAVPSPAAPGAVAHRTLLYVEDSAANLQLVVSMIARRPDLRLLSANTGLLGIEIARASRPDVILMDINLPGMSGLEAMQILRGDPSTAHIPVVALSANAMPRDIEWGLQAGFFRYLTKPLRVGEFLETLDVALSTPPKEA